MKLNLKDQSWAHEKQRNTIKSKYVISAIFKPLFILPPFPAVFEENISVYNFLLLRIVKLVIWVNLNFLNKYVKIRLIDKVLAKAYFYRKQRFWREQWQKYYKKIICI